MDVLLRAMRIYEDTLSSTCTRSLCLSTETATQGRVKALGLQEWISILVNKFKHFSLAALGLGGQPTIPQSDDVFYKHYNKTFFLHLSPCAY